MSLFVEQQALPLREAIEFYQHKHNWTNRLIAGDSLLVMNSLLEKEGMAGHVQMVYLDPPYGIRYGSNFQPFVNKREVKDGKDEDLTQEPETLKAFRDTWELGIHSYLTYLRDRLLLARELLHESGSIFVQISDENVHLVRNLLDDVFGQSNFVSQIAYTTSGSFTSTLLSRAGDYIIWYAKDINNIKYHELLTLKTNPIEDQQSKYDQIELTDGLRRAMTSDEKRGLQPIPNGSRIFRVDTLVSQGYRKHTTVEYEFDGQIYHPGPQNNWKASIAGMDRLKANRRLISSGGGKLGYIRYFDDFPAQRITNIWDDIGGGVQSRSDPKVYVVQTGVSVIQRCLLMTTEPGDIVFDPTCGSGTTAYVAEQWGRRWITCDTSRVSVTLARQRLMTAQFDYYKLAQPDEGVGSGFKYKTVPHVTLKSIANNEPPAQETLYDQPFTDASKHRITGPFTVEAVPAPSVQALTDVTADEAASQPADTSIARSGETLRQAEWRDELQRTGIRSRRGDKLTFARVEPLAGTRWLHADAEVNATDGQAAQRAVISFGPEHQPMDRLQVARALEEASRLFPKPKMVIFATFQFDPEAAREIEETNWPGVTLLKAQMNADLLTDDLKKKRTSNESFWLIGQPDVRVVSEEWLVDSKGRIITHYGCYQKLSGLNRLAEINGLDEKDLLLYAALSERRDLWLDLATQAGSSVSGVQHRRGTSPTNNRGIQTIFGHRQRLDGGIGDLDSVIHQFELSEPGRFRRFIEGLRRNHEISQRLAPLTQKLTPLHSPLLTTHYSLIEVLGFDYYNTRSGEIESGDKHNIALWLLDTDYDGRSLFPRQVFFPMAGEKDGWSRLAKNLKAEIDEELIEAYRGTVSLPFVAGENKRLAVKIVDDRGIESLKVIDVL